MRPVRIAVIGGGHLGRIHARILCGLKQFDLLGVVDTDAKARAAIEQQMNVPVFADYRCLGADVDAVVIATPTQSHYPIAVDCLNRGFHALIEKPITQDIQQADHLIHLADQQQVVLQVGHVERFNPAFQRAREEMPAVRYFEAQRLSGYTFRSTDVGVVLDLMIHDLDLLASLVPSPLLETRAVGIAVFGPHEDIAQARLEFADGTVANLTASRFSFRPARSISWFSEAGFVNADLGNGTAKTVCVPPTMRGEHRDVADLSVEQREQVRESLFENVLPSSELEIHTHNAIEQEHLDLFQAITDGGQPRVTGRHGRRALSMALGIVQAIRTHRWSDQLSTRVGHQADKIRLLPTADQSSHLKAG